MILIILIVNYAFIKCLFYLSVGALSISLLILIITLICQAIRLIFSILLPSLVNLLFIILSNGLTPFSLILFIYFHIFPVASSYFIHKFIVISITFQKISYLVFTYTFLTLPNVAFNFELYFIE